jgi:hypothetical protein
MSIQLIWLVEIFSTQFEEKIYPTHIFLSYYYFLETSKSIIAGPKNKK